MAKARWKPSTTHAKQWPGKAEDECTHDQGYGEARGTRRKRRRNREAVAMINISSKYAGAEDTGMDRSHVS